MNKPIKLNRVNDKESNNKPFNQSSQHSDRFYKNKSFKNFSQEKEESEHNSNYDYEFNQNKHEIKEIEYEKKYYENDYDHSQISSRPNNYKTDKYFKSNVNNDKFDNESNQNYRSHNKNYHQKGYNYYQKNDSFNSKGKNYDSNQKNYYSNSKVYEDKGRKNYFNQKNNEANERFQETNEEYYEIRETSLNENSRENNNKRQEHKNNDNSYIEENKYLNKENYGKTKKSYFKNQNNYNEQNGDIYANKNYEKRGSNKNKFHNGDYFDVAFSLDKSKNQNIDLANTKKSIEKQYNETNINKLFEQAPIPDAQASDKIGTDNGLPNSSEVKETEAPKEKAAENTTKIEDDLKKVNEKTEQKRSSYKMEVEKISLSITNISINDHKQEEKKQESEIKKDLQKDVSVNQENGMDSKLKSEINPSSKENDSSAKLKNGKDVIEESNLGNKSLDKESKIQNPEDQSANFDFFKQIPKNSFINAINYNNYFFGNNNPRDMKKEDFEKSNLQNNFGFGMSMNIPNPYHRIPHPNYKPFSAPSATPFIPMPFYPGNPDYSGSQNTYPHQMIGLYPSQYMIPYPFMESYVPIPSYQNSYPYLNKNGQLLYSNYANNVTNPASKSNANASINQDVSK